MNNTPKRFIRLAAFMLALVLLVCLANTYLIQTDAISCVIMKEMLARDDIELCFVGSSVVRDHFNPAIISEITGLTAFNAAFPSASLQADIAVTEELFKKNDPQWTVLVVEPYNFNTAKENPETEYMLMPHLTDWRVKLDYYLRLCKEDGFYLDRLLIFRDFFATSLADVAKAIGLRHNTEATFKKVAEGMDPSTTYMGQGFLRNTPDYTVEDDVRRQMARVEDPGYVYELLEPSKEMLLEYKALCEEKGTNLLVVVFPNHTSHMLSEPECLPYSRSLMNFCAQNDIPCYNFSLAKPELVPLLDEYYFDLYHMNGTGADLFSEAFARFFNLYAAGEDVSGLFYASDEEYLASIDFIVNTWLFPAQEENAFLADCNRGSLVQPEYRFVLRRPDGTEELVRDYTPDGGITAEIPEGCDLRVYARPQGNEEAEPVYYDYPTDYDAYYGKKLAE
ncbi:MAG: hypothetical protein Q4F18_10715 [Clostridia bacterium]|nr:hypothetical protein [Clostridia bacterium]